MGLFSKKKNKSDEIPFEIKEYGSKRTYMFVATDERGALEMLRYTLDSSTNPSDISDDYVIDRHNGVWDKVKGTGSLNAKKQPMRNHELILVFYKKQCVYNPQKTIGHTLKKSYRPKDFRTEVYGKMKK